MALSGSLPQINLGVQGVTQGGHHSGAQRVNPEFRVGSNFRIIAEQYFSGVENVVEFLENMDNNIYYEIPTQLACAYLKGHLTGRALNWFEVLGYRVVEDKATDYAHLKQALPEQFPVVRNRSELETRFYSSSQKHNQKPSDFVYDLLKIHKILKLEITEEKLIDPIISRLEPQILDYVEVRNPRTTSNLLQIIDKYEDRFLNRKIRGSSWESRDIKPNENNRFPNRNRQENWRETRGNNRYVDNNRPRREFKRFESQGVVDNQRFDGRRRGGQSDHRFHNQGGRQDGSRNSTFRALWDTGVEKSFISEEVYRKYFSYRPRQKTKDRVVTAQEATCCHLGRFELQIRIREFQKTWEFHILNNMQHQCILDLPGLTHVLYHEIDTGDKRPVVSRPYRYDRVKQGIIDSHIEKMLQEALRALALNSREQLIREQREDPELGPIFHYVENPDDGSVNATICEN
ncbi:uncharacterized protein TNCV_4208401 [Trichonephila clavipes]|nr:uncharacterized protein TNCV_4208401 [Trichonephila clavipes]